MQETLSPQVIKANRSARSAGAVGKNALVPKIVQEMFKPEENKVILDYGSGPKMIHAENLENLGYNVSSFDFGDNWRYGMEYDVIKIYDVIYASNVMNTWSDEIMTRESLMEIYLGLKSGGTFIGNFPVKPRYNPTMNNLKLFGIMRDIFTDVTENPKNIFICVK